MILLSLLLVIGSAVMLVLGLADANQVLIWASIAASIVAALALTVSVMRRRGESEAGVSGLQLPPALGVGGSSTLVDGGRHHAADRREVPSSERLPETLPGTFSTERPVVGQPPAGYADSEASRHPDPPDEPPEEDVSASDALRVVDLLDEVLVVDGRPRYHLPGCRHLIGRETVALSVSEARQSEFTPCAWCRPDSTIANRARGIGGNS